MKLERRLPAFAPWLLVISMVVRTLVIVTGFGNESIDLYVYWSLAPHVLDGDLYQVFSPHSPPPAPLNFNCGIAFKAGISFAVSCGIA